MKRDRYSRLCFVILAGLTLLLTPAKTDAAETTEKNQHLLAVSPHIASDYEKYKKVNIPGFFAISENGRSSGFAYCRADAPCGKAVSDLAILFCEKAAQKKSCKLFAKSEKIIWQGKLLQPSVDDVALIDRGWYAFYSEMSWPSVLGDKSNKKQKGWVLLPPGELKTGWFKFSMLDGKNTCYGSYSSIDVAQGSWMMNCPRGMAAAGTYLKKGKHWVSDGKDQKGTSVQIIAYFK